MGGYSQKELKGILEHFNMERQAYTFSTLNIGYINDTYLVSLNGQPEYILQRINHGVFKNIEGLMMNIDMALRHLKDVDYSQIKLIPIVTGKTYISLESGYWRIMTYIAGSTTYNTTTEPKIAFEAGRLIGKFHDLLANESVERYTDTIPKFHDLELREMQFLGALARASNEKKKVAESAITFSHEMLITLASMNNAQLPIRVCHNDTKLNNILFSKGTKKALCLIDLDTLMKGYFHYDFGDAIRTIVNTAPEDEQDHAKITFNKKLFEAFIHGLAANEPFLTLKEVQALPYGVILLPFLHGIRALTDYLNGNIYYKVSYENQNLDRCLSLFDFTNKAYKNLAYMESEVRNTLRAVEN